MKKTELYKNYVIYSILVVFYVKVRRAHQIIIFVVMEHLIIK